MSILFMAQPKKREGEKEERGLHSHGVKWQLSHCYFKSHNFMLEISEVFSA